jgi:hypothetical protein
MEAVLDHLGGYTTLEGISLFGGCTTLVYHLGGCTTMELESVQVALYMH